MVRSSAVQLFRFNTVTQNVCSQDKGRRSTLSHMLLVQIKLGPNWFPAFGMCGRCISLENRKKNTLLHIDEQRSAKTKSASIFMRTDQSVLVLT